MTNIKYITFFLVLVTLTSCIGNLDSSNYRYVQKGMTVKQVDSIMGPYDYITPSHLIDTTAIFQYNYSNGIIAAGDAFVAFNADSLVVLASCGCE